MPVKTLGFIYETGSSLFTSIGDIERVNGLLKILDPESPRQVRAHEIREAERRGTVFFFARFAYEMLLRPQLVGMASLCPIQCLGQRKGIVEDVAVFAEFEGEGIDSGLMGKIIEYAEKDGMSYLELTSHPSRERANEMYQKLGFERRETNYYHLKL